ncbi:cytochrome o ubiquinol oxidase subunit IV [Alicyclobacillus fodiniaquatilis]|jgi:cytochrome aa3 quinol oxidase subunit IV|uniref:Cytochrome o ubiquinol/quinol oxidase subunit IV n=1 Tax=Alicyclobacillus fodiniaquatilis TaxID=1661150 RepID=A0ABW4JED6_9BACL
MATPDEHVQRPHREHGLGLPILGFVLSIVLTIIALWLHTNGRMGPGALVTTILILAVVQIVIQLFFFMHVTETDGETAWHAWFLALGLFLVIAIVAGSIWIMTFGTEAY